MSPILLALMLQAAAPVPAAAGAAAPGNTAASSDIVTVTGVRMEDLAAAVARCKASPCPVRQDIVAAIRYAEALFRSGAYVRASQELQAAISRTRSAAAVEPVALSQLYFAQANVTAHEGDQRRHARAVHASASVLRAALPAGSPRLLIAELREADLALRLGRWNDAEAGYRGVIRTARAAGHAAIADGAELHRAGLLRAIGRNREALALLGRIIAAPADDAATRSVRQGAIALAARYARADGDTAATARWIALLLKQPPGSEPQLLWNRPLRSPPIRWRAISSQSPPTPTPGPAISRDCNGWTSASGYVATAASIPPRSCAAHAPMAGRHRCYA